MSGMNLRPFCPKSQGTIAITNAVAAAAAIAIEYGASELVLYNTSASAIAYVRCDIVPNNTDTAPGLATIPVAGGVTGAFPVPPGGQIRISPGVGYKWFSAIASAADGTLLVTPGHGF